MGPAGPRGRGQFPTILTPPPLAPSSDVGMVFAWIRSVGTAGGLKCRRG